MVLRETHAYTRLIKTCASIVVTHERGENLKPITDSIAYLALQL